MRNKFLKATIASFVLVISGLANAGLIVIGDVDAGHTASRSINFGLFENIRNNGTDLLWLDGGSGFNSNYRYTNLQNQWSLGGSTIEFDSTADISASLSGRDLVVITQEFQGLSLFTSTAQSALGNYLTGGGNILYIAQSGGATFSDSYNSFLTGIGSAIQYTTVRGLVHGGRSWINHATPYWSPSATQFHLDGITPLVGGNSLVVGASGNVGVAYEDHTQVPEPSTLAIFALGMIGLASRRFKKQS